MSAVQEERGPRIRLFSKSEGSASKMVSVGEAFGIASSFCYPSMTYFTVPRLVMTPGNKNKTTKSNMLIII